MAGVTANGGPVSAAALMSSAGESFRYPRIVGNRDDLPDVPTGEPVTAAANAGADALWRERSFRCVTTVCTPCSLAPPRLAKNSSRPVFDRPRRRALRLRIIARWLSASSRVRNWLLTRTSDSITDGYGPRAPAPAWRDFVPLTRTSAIGTTMRSNFRTEEKCYWHFLPPVSEQRSFSFRSAVSLPIGFVLSNHTPK